MSNNLLSLLLDLSNKIKYDPWISVPPHGREQGTLVLRVQWYFKTITHGFDRTFTPEEINACGQELLEKFVYEANELIESILLEIGKASLKCQTKKN